MVKSEETSKKISVRLDAEAARRLDEAKSKGYTTSQYVNRIIKNSSAVGIDLGSIRSIMISISKLQYQLEFEENPEVKENMREELNQICRALKSFQDHTPIKMH